jgi:ribonuclease HII
MITHIIGIDEVGRGPLAGPVTLCACSTRVDFDFSKFDGIRDSKKLSAKKRKEWFKVFEDLKNAGLINFAISSVSAEEIDRIGISKCISRAITETLSGVNLSPENVEVRLDGALRAPSQFLFQKTIIKGDEKEPIISAASIVAKVTRDKYMDELGKQFPVYGFEKHKGYGTASHIEAIKTHGLTKFHRKTYIHI